MKKLKNNEKINMFRGQILELQSSIKDQAARIAGGFVKIPSQELYVLLSHMRQELDMITDIDGLIVIEEQKK